jgi:hypothetical protein
MKQAGSVDNTSDLCLKGECLQCRQKPRLSWERNIFFIFLYLSIYLFINKNVDIGPVIIPRLFDPILVSVYYCFVVSIETLEVY